MGFYKKIILYSSIFACLSANSTPIFDSQCLMNIEDIIFKWCKKLGILDFETQRFMHYMEQTNCMLAKKQSFFYEMEGFIAQLELNCPESIELVSAKQRFNKWLNIADNELKRVIRTVKEKRDCLQARKDNAGLECRRNWLANKYKELKNNYDYDPERIECIFRKIKFLYKQMKDIECKIDYALSINENLLSRLGSFRSEVQLEAVILKQKIGCCCWPY